MIRIATTMFIALVAITATGVDAWLAWTISAQAADGTAREALAGVGQPGSVVDDVAGFARRTAGDFWSWVQDSYSRRPVVMVGLAGLVLMPPLALIGFILHWLGSAAGREATRPAALPATAVPDSGWIIVEGGSWGAMALDRDLTQIGRESDNDVCIDDETVHRYHAVIERSREAGFIISDMSGPDGNGMTVNGTRRTTYSLADGDQVGLGKARLRFSTIVQSTNPGVPTGNVADRGGVTETVRLKRSGGES